MSTIITCPECDGKFKMAAEPTPGKRVKCRCGHIFAPADQVQSPSASAADRIVVECQECGKRLGVPPSARGKRVRCSQCSAVVTVPVEQVQKAPPPVQSVTTETARQRPDNRRQDRFGEEVAVGEPPRRPRRKPAFGTAEIIAVALVVAYLGALGAVWFGAFGKRFDFPPLAQANPNHNHAPPNGNINDPPPNGNAVLKKDPALEAKRTAARDKKRLAAKAYEQKVIIPALAKRPADPNSRGELAVFRSVKGTNNLLQFSHDSSLLASGGRYSKVVRITNLKSGSATSINLDDSLLSFALSPDNKVLATGHSNQPCIRFWDVQSGKLAGNLPTRHQANDIVYAPDGKTLVVAQTPNGQGVMPIQVWDLESRTPTASIGRVPHVFDFDAKQVVRASHGDILVTAHANDEVVIWNLKNKTELHSAKDTERVRSLALSPDGWTLAIGRGGFNRGAVEVIDVLTKKSAFPTKRFKEIQSLAFSPDGKVLAIGHGSYRANPLTLISSQTGEVIRTLSDQTIRGVDSIAFSPGGTIVALGGENSSVYLWRTKDLVDKSAIIAEKVIAKIKSWTNVKRTANGYYVNTYSEATDAGVQLLAQIPNLVGLDLGSARKLTEKGLAALAKLTKLQELRLDGLDKVTDKTLVHLKDLKALQSLDLGGCGKITDAGLAHLSKLSNLTQLKLGGLFKLSNNGLKHIANLKNLEVLDLAYNNNITDAGMVHLENLNKLKRLELDGTQVTAAGLAHLAKMKEMEHLELSRISVGDTGIKHLAGMTKMKWLDLYNALISDAGMVHLSTMTNMERLNLSRNTKITGAGMVHLKGMTQMTALYLYDTKVDDAGLQFVKGMTKLKNLDIGKTAVTDDGIRHLAGLTELQTLQIDYLPGLKGPGLAHLKALTKLRSLQLRNTAIDDAGFAAIKNLTFLTGLTVPEGVTDAGLAHIANLTNLYALDLPEAKGVKGPGLVHLKNLGRVTYLNLFNTGVTDDGLKYLKAITQIRNLVLPKRIGDAGLAHLKSLTNLGSLNLSESKVTDAGLVHLQGLGKLRSLYLRKTAVTQKGIDALEKSLPKLRVYTN